MVRPILIIGNKTYSSWSLRPWLLMRHTGIAFDEVVIPLHEEFSAKKLEAQSPSGKVPVLIDGSMRIWESIAIVEHLAERYPLKTIWPRDFAARGHARAISAEMHAGFAALRRECPMNIRHKLLDRPPISREADADLRRLEEIWTETRRKFGSGGPFLFGEFSAADAMFAPVATRIQTFELGVGGEARAYATALLNLPAYAEWRLAAMREPWTIQDYE